MKRVTTRREVAAAVDAARSAGARIGFVPTMGFLHDGHLALVNRARELADYTVISVFVNPLQFGPGEDLDRYPRDLERDAELSQARGVDLFFAPDVGEMYPAGEPAVTVQAPRLSDRLCGAFRPGHFQGVLTVVAKLFHIVRPDVALFGRKDFQQLVLVRRMARDLDFPVEVAEAETVREADGLALSSRNVLLSAEARAEAPLLNRALIAAQSAFAAGERDAAKLIERARSVLAEGRRIRPQHVELVDPESLDPVARAEPGHVMALAALLDSTRLIDNRALE